MKKVILLVTAVFILMGISLPINSYCATLFEDNFDYPHDWSPTQKKYPNSIEYWPANKVADAPPPPARYFCYRVGGSMFTHVGHNTFCIDSTNHRGTSGRGLTVWNESDDRFWASDGILGVLLDPNGNGYKELYIRFYMKFQPGWKWNTSNSPQQKFVRASHYINDGRNPFQFFQLGSHHPIWVGELAKWGTGTYPITYFSSYFYESSYYPSLAIPKHEDNTNYFFHEGANYSSYNEEGAKKDFWDPNMIGDGKWHCWELYLKMNSAIGVPDGEQKFWYDGKLVDKTKDLAWSDETSVVKGTNGNKYCCILRHQSSANNRPITGTDWRKYWQLTDSKRQGKEWATSTYYGLSSSNPRSFWNFVAIGGNNFNAFAPNEKEAEQWYAIDDLVIADKYIGPDENGKPASPKNLHIINTR
jgi:hypothetical protein